MVFEDFRREIIIALGGQLVDVEFDPVQFACDQDDIPFDENESIMYAFNKAKRTFIQRGNNNYEKAFAKLDVVKGQRLYQLPPVEEGHIDTIVKIIRPSSGFNVNDPFSQVAYDNVFAGVGTGGGGCQYMQGTANFLSYELTLQTIEKIRTYSAYDVDFIHNKRKNTIELLQPPKGNQTWFLECYKDLSDEEYMDVLWIQEWAIAEAKQILGIAYRKFQSVPGPTGEVSLNGDAWIQEANEQKRQLLEDLDHGISGDIDYYDVTMG